MTEILQRFAHAREMFGSLSEQELSRFTYRKLRAGDYLYHEGDLAGTAFFYILSGICVSDAVVKGCENTLPVQYVAGDFSGLREMLYASPQLRSFSVCCRTAVEVVELPRDEINSFVSSHPQLPFMIVRRELEKMFKAQEVLVNCTSRKTDQAVAYYLGHLYDVYRTLYAADYTGEVRILDTHKELCATLGCSKRTVDRYIAEFADNGMISLKRGKIHISTAQRSAIADYIS